MLWNVHMPDRYLHSLISIFKMSRKKKKKKKIHIFSTWFIFCWALYFMEPLKCDKRVYRHFNREKTVQNWFLWRRIIDNAVDRQKKISGKTGMKNWENRGEYLGFGDLNIHLSWSCAVCSWIEDCLLSETLYIKLWCEISNNQNIYFY